MKAKKKPIEKISVADLGVDLAPRLKVLKFEEPPKRVGGAKVRNRNGSTLQILTTPFRLRTSMNSSRSYMKQVSKL